MHHLKKHRCIVNVEKLTKHRFDSMHRRYYTSSVFFKYIDVYRPRPLLPTVTVSQCLSKTCVVSAK